MRTGRDGYFSAASSGAVNATRATGTATDRIRNFTRISCGNPNGNASGPVWSVRHENSARWCDAAEHDIAVPRMGVFAGVVCVGHHGDGGDTAGFRAKSALVVFIDITGDVLPRTDFFAA